MHSIYRAGTTNSCQETGTQCAPGSMVGAIVLSGDLLLFLLVLNRDDLTPWKMPKEGKYYDRRCGHVLLDDGDAF